MEHSDTNSTRSDHTEPDPAADPRPRPESQPDTEPLADYVKRKETGDYLEKLAEKLATKRPVRTRTSDQ